MSKFEPPVNIAAPLRTRHDAAVRLHEPATRAAATDVERFVLSELAGETAMGYGKLLSRVADFLYRRVLELGASALDIGMFGSSLFVAEARRELASANGQLWEIDYEDGSQELLSSRSVNRPRQLSRVSPNQN